jgi:predicted MPP superfamily phosphohydrolase
MIGRSLRWHTRIKLSIANRVGVPIHRVMNLLPNYEFGLARLELSRIACRSEALAGRRAVHITDLHLDRYQPRHDAVLRSIADLRPDWVFVTGDLLNVPEGLGPLFRFLSGLRQVAPVYLTLGNHDHYSGVPVDRFVELADRHKLCLLVNQVAFVTLARGELGIVGLDDPSLHRADIRCIPGPRPNRFTVLLAHAPNVLDQLDHTHGVDLALCGHSHGGQWQFKYVKPFWLPYGCVGRTNGLYQRNGHRLYVNRGIGWSGLPIRLSCPPEILVIDWIACAADKPQAAS